MAGVNGERVLDNPKLLSTQQLLSFADRADPIIKVLCERLETYVNAGAKERLAVNEFKAELNALVDKL